jgi:hypothetical protein
MSDFNVRAEAARREGRLEGLREACLDSVLQYHPRTASAVLPAILAEKSEARLIRWTAEWPAACEGLRFSPLVRGVVRRPARPVTRDR